jgi:hypothetical protein
MSEPTDQPEPSDVGKIRVTEVSVSHTGAYQAPRPETLRWSKASLGLGVASVLLAPVFGLGALVALPSLAVGHLARNREPQALVRSTVGLWLTYAGLLVGGAVLVFVALPLTLAFLISMGYILPD